VGRFDYSQKGIDKLEFIMDEALRNGAQFVCVGIDADDQAKEVLARMKRKARALNHRGVLILEDKKVDGKLFFQSEFGSLLRAATSIPVFPSIYEPCGLVQGELNRYGKKVVATKTGGFMDTLNNTNGYLFERLANWYTDEQNQAIAQTLRSAIANAVLFQNALYDGTEDDQRPFLEQTRTIMRNARNSTWERTPDGSLSTIRRLELAYAKAFTRRRKRGQVTTPLQTLKI
jgi:glycogen synthase